MKTRILLPLLAVVLFALLPAYADEDWACQNVAGVLMTDIGAITGVKPPVNPPINLGPSFGDLGGAVSAQILGQNADGSFNVQHYWVSKEGDTIKFSQAVLYPAYVPGTSGVAAVPWGHYRAFVIPGGTGKWAHARGYIDCFGIADFNDLTLVLRYRGTICHRPAPPPR